MKNIFITGMLRSGTTLLDKVLHNHPKLAVASEAYPYVYIEIKEKYYKEQGVITLFPLDNYFLSGKAMLNDFYDFLDEYFIPKDKILDMFTRMRDYNGQRTPAVISDKYFEHVKSGVFKKVYNDLVGVVAQEYSEKQPVYSGFKEVLCEEYLPYILSEISNTKGIIIIRDPRDVIASLSYGNYEEYGGKRRPTLFNLRNWRKSVAFALYLEENPNFKLIKYENLVKDFDKVLNDLTDFLGVKSYKEGVFANGIRDQQGNIWKGNSSFEAKDFINKNSMRKYKSILPEEIIKYVETCCYPEMKYLKYDFEKVEDFNEKNIRKFKEPFKIKRENFNTNYSSNKTRIKNEVTRYKKLNQDLSKSEKEKWYIFEEVYYKFNKAFIKREDEY